MRAHFDGYSRPVYLETENGQVKVHVGAGMIQKPNGDLEYISLHLPGDRTYLARDTITGDHTIIVLPEGLTPETFGWKGWQFIKLSVLIGEIKDTEDKS